MSAWLVLKTYAYNSNPSTYCKLKFISNYWSFMYRQCHRVKGLKRLCFLRK